MQSIEAIAPAATETDLAVLEQPRTARHFIEPRQARELFNDLMEPSPLVYWSDFLASLFVAATGLVVAWSAPQFSLVWCSACLAASLAVYRVIIFSHELAHLRQGAVPGFKFAWNLIAGIGLMLPSVFYTGVHDDHHRTSTYGTEQDPEYRPFAGAQLEIVLFTLHSLLIYPALAVRFFLLAPIGLLYAPLHRWLERKASSFTMNPRYARRMTDTQQRELRWMEAAILLAWGGLICMLVHFHAEWKFVTLYLTIVQPAAIVNSLRTLAAHRYETDGSTRGKREQVLDSVDIPGAAYTALWAPVGLRYHALHHHFPTLPYHNLGAAHRRLVNALSRDNDYHRTRSASLWSALSQLWTAKQPASGQEARR